MAERGITGPLDLFENPRGSAKLFSKGDAAADLTAPLAAESAIMAANVKAFPCLATGQSVAAAGIEMHHRLRGMVDGLRAFRLIIPDTPGLRRQKVDPGRIKPLSREAADHSFNFLAAVSLIDGAFGLAQFEDERWTDPMVCALMAQLEIVNDSAWNTRAPDSYPCSLEVRTQDGRDELVEVPYPPGFFPRPARHRDCGEEVSRVDGIDPRARRTRSHHRTRDGVGREPLLHRPDGVGSGLCGLIGAAY